MKEKSFHEALTYESFVERLDYLRLYSDNPSNQQRKLMNKFYKSYAWKQARDFVIHRDLACDLAVPNLFIEGPILVHHIQPITEEDLMNNSPLLLSPDNLITVSMNTHNKIHYRNEKDDPVVLDRTPGDTNLW